MRVAKALNSLYREDGSLKTVSAGAANLNNYRRIFPGQLLPVLGMYANRQTKILLFLLANLDANNLIYCTYEDVMKSCGMKDKKVVAKVFRDLQAAEVLVKTSQSHYMLNPALILQGNDQKYGLLAVTFNQLLEEKERKDKKKKKNEEEKEEEKIKK